MNAFAQRLLSRTALATTLALGLACLAPSARADEQTVKLIQLLIQKGILTSGQAGELLRETGPAPKGKRGRAAPAAAAPVEEEAPPARQGEIRVTYVPDFVRKQIADQVRAQVLTESKEEGWAAPNALPEWTKRVRVFGDIRARYEADIFEKGNYNSFVNYAAINNGSPFDATTGALPPILDTTQDRNRFRLRARIGVEAELADNVQTIIRVGTGDPNGPVATNATLGENGAFSKYSIFLDRAYVAFEPDSHSTIWAGRSPNPFTTTDILFYNDLGFDGVSAHYEHAVGSAANAVFTAGAFPLFNTDLAFSTNVQNKYPSTDAYLFAVQGGADYTFRPNLIGHFNVGFFDFTGVQGGVSAPCFVQPGTSTTYACTTDDTRYLNGQFGNTVYAIRNIQPVNGSTATSVDPQYYGLAARFAVLEVHPRFDILTYTPYQVEIEGDYIKNLAFNRTAILDHGAPNEIPGPANNYGSSSVAGKLGPYQGGDTGYFAKVSFGYPKVKHLWEWNVSATYKYIETDATIDALDDAEFHLGGTNARGYQLQGIVGVADNTNVSLRWLSSQVVSGPQDGNDVILLDLNASF
jgi:hypothetical protein